MIARPWAWGLAALAGCVAPPTLDPRPDEPGVVVTGQAPDAPIDDREPADDTAGLGPPTPGEVRTSAALGPVRFVPAGDGVRGCLEGRDDIDGGCFPEELPAHRVTLTRALWVAESELTQARWRALGFTNPSRFVGADRPVHSATWWEALEAANAASEVDGLPACYTLVGCDASAVGTGRTCASAQVTAASGRLADCTGWRLPTEAEWEHAARGGQPFAYAGHADAENVAWHRGNSGGVSHPVCRRQRGGFGLCDASGNLWEWVADAYVAYAPGDLVDPFVAEADSPVRVGRGGGWDGGAMRSRLAHRGFAHPDSRSDHVGVRLVRTAP